MSDADTVTVTSVFPGSQPTDPAPAPAGWYPDPRTGAQQRYWDGGAWTHHTAPSVTAAAPGAQYAANLAATMRPVGLVLTVVFLLFWSVIWFGVSAAILIPRHPDNAVAVNGTVTATTPVWVSGSKSSGGWGCEATVAYNVHGQAFQVMSHAERPCSWTVGEAVAVEYNAADPSDALIPDTPPPWAYLFPIVGLLAVGAAVAKVVKTAKVTRAAAS